MTWPILSVVALGAWHGVNPGMGWLFAVALGMQEQERRAVWRALLPLAAGHAAAIALALVVGLIAGRFVPADTLAWGVAVTLVGFGIARLVRNRHPRYGGMRMSMRALTMWSFLMASAHGAGLMVLPFVLPYARQQQAEVAAVDAPAANTAAAKPPAAAPQHAHPGHSILAAPGENNLFSFAVMTAHTLGFLLATGFIALIVYEKLGLRMLRSIWVNLDLVWGIALIITGVLTPLLA